MKTIQIKREDRPTASRLNSQLADGDTRFIYDCWYVAGRINEFGRQLVERTLLGESVVFYRRTDEKPVALQNRCPHRSFPLAQGALEGDNVRCGYHGLAFDSSGACVDVPTQNVIPPSLCIREYPVVERGPYVWIWMGKADMADESLIPDTSWLWSPDWTFAEDYVSFNANYVGLHENLLDLSHFTYLHPSTLGTPEYARTPCEVDADGDRVRISRFVAECDVPPIYEKTGIKGKMSRHTVSDFVTPALHHASAVMRDLKEDRERRDFTIYISHFITPATQNSTHYWFAFARDFALTNPEVTRYMGASALKAFREDIHALHEITRMYSLEPQAPSYEIHIKSDQAGVATRRVLRRLAEGNQNV
ncbi:aromatic ring-hydroxylating dioxygenase subunit alpha [Paraburkholderia domus]|uniref:aromatic ring-hydroxylating dioxygenase subunit alpha n=1 Tax=Paraburkholderia domus TaxID=2793075 RepID=UPI001914A152|nr:aromatic ring-hydroxylating dioxygenase subunit alpha [Paraburkholderia domus]MBK5065918.1 aromatic ring-hydroxylating dioxygenase subunit alpha [Burkholderia sp. R-70199]CAE6959445.1 Toluene-4-sulfonate monooxygenase system iron-sulfur subunit TsaM1 [Paraburkholderia domus]